jgi:osmotically-inducible protein OsmY
VARYHFNIRNGTGFTADDEGMDLSSEADARSHAIEGARSLISAEVLQGTLDLNGQIEVTDEGQEAVMTVRFVEAVVEPAAVGEQAAR